MRKLEPYYTNGVSTLYKGDVNEVTGRLPRASAHCIVTSPPYWGLRDYHGLQGQIGLEDTVQEYLEKVVTSLRSARRLLRRDGVCWVVIGDTYSGGTHDKKSFRADRAEVNVIRKRNPLGQKQACLVPERLAIALQEDGWVVRLPGVWHKKNCRPESARDRPTRDHETILMLTRSKSYWYDREGFKEDILSGPSDVRKMREGKDRINTKYRDMDDKMMASEWRSKISRKRAVGSPDGRNARSVWSISATQLAHEHYAAFPRELVRRCVLLSTSEQGCCSRCGKQYRRLVEPSEEYSRHLGKSLIRHTNELTHGTSNHFPGVWTRAAEYITVGWRPGCSCQAPAIPSLVLDPFVGSGTTCVESQALGRRSLGIDLSRPYLDIAVSRLQEVSQPMLLDLKMRDQEPQQGAFDVPSI